MSKKPFTKQTILAVSLIVFFICSAFAAHSFELNHGIRLEAAQQNCTDAEIIKAFQAKVKANAEEFAGLQRRVNPVIKDGKLTLQGCVDTKAQRKALDKIANKVSCGREVNNLLVISKNCGGCDKATQKECGDTCIDKRDDCNLIQ
jgi:osmotically-inducible protein OsmY